MPIVPVPKGNDITVYTYVVTHGAPVCNPNLAPCAGAKSLLLHPTSDDDG